MTDPLDNAREKLKRARSHLANLNRRVTLLRSEPDRHRFLVSYDADEGRYVVYSKMSSKPFPNLSLIVGDLVHCARGALDFVAWQLACKKLGREPSEKQAREIQFPITPDVNKFNAARLWPFVGQEERGEMLRHQPHPESDPGNQHLTVLQWISNRDKHRLIVPFSVLIDPPLLPNYTFDPPLPAGSFTNFSFLTGPKKGASESEIIYEGDPTTVRFGWLEVTPPPPPGTKVALNPDVPIDVLFVGPAGYLSVTDIKALLDRVEFVVGSFERFL